MSATSQNLLGRLYPQVKRVIVLSPLLLGLSCVESNTPLCSDSVGKLSVEKASCVVFDGDKTLVVYLMGGTVEFPEGSVNGRETASCTAERAVWRLSGIQVRAVNLLANVNGRKPYYRCNIVSASEIKVQKQMGIVDVQWVPISQLDNLRWRSDYERQLILPKIQ